MAFRTGSLFFPTDANDDAAFYRLEVRDVSIRADVVPEREQIRRKRRDLSEENINIETTFAVARRVLLRMEKRIEGKWIEVGKALWESEMADYEKLPEVIMEKSLALRDEKNSVVKQNVSD